MEKLKTLINNAIVIPISNLFWRITNPIIVYVNNIWTQVSEPIIKLIGQISTSTKTFLFYLTIFTIVFFILLLFAFIIYFLFYYLYVPVLYHIFPVFFQFSPTESQPPYAYIDFTNNRNTKFLSSGQTYDISIDLYIPESQVNQELGMFMISVELLSFDNLTIHSSSRPATLHFKSKLYQQIYTFFYSLPLLFGFIDESQYLNIPLMEGIYDSFSWSAPITKAKITLSKPEIQVYSSRIRLDARFSGLRYLMYRWFFTSAIVGISTILFWEGIIVLLIYFLLLKNPSDENLYGSRLESDDRRTKTRKRSGGKKSRSEKVTSKEQVSGLRHDFQTMITSTQTLLVGSSSKEETSKDDDFDDFFIESSNEDLDKNDFEEVQIEERDEEIESEEEKEEIEKTEPQHVKSMEKGKEKEKKEKEKGKLKKRK